MKNILKKKKDSNNDPNRSALFGGKDNSRAASNDPYARRPDPYAQRSDPYARDPYTSRGHQSQNSPYSSTSRVDSSDSYDSSRNALFGNRPPPTQSGQYNHSRPYDEQPREEDRYDEYQKQAQEDDDDVEAIKQEIRFTKQESLSATRNAIRIASEAEEQGRSTLERLGGQSEKLAGIERSLDISAAHARVAEEKARELKTLNRSIFAVHVSSPFGGSARAEKEERKIVERHEQEREERERNRKYAYDSAQRVNSALSKPGTGRKVNGNQHPRSTIAARSQFSFEEDEEDIQMEKDIDANLNALGDITGRLKGLALATQTEIEAQNTKLDQIANKVLLFFFCVG